MKQEEKDERIKQLEKELQELKEMDDIFEITEKEPDRWRAVRGGAYHFIYYAGDVKSCLDHRGGDDNLMHKNGNYFKTREDALRSSLYFMMHSEYEYWIPCTGMPRPETTPEGTQFYCESNNEWMDIQTDPVGWKHNLYRWPKTSYRGE
jgi:hypothetical protein